MCFKYDFKKYKLIGFYYYVNVNSSSFFDLEGLIRSLLSSNNSSSFGLILIFNKNAVLFKELLFLKQLIIYFFSKKIYFGIWGLPDCVIRYIYQDGFDYVLFNEYLIPENSFSLFFFDKDYYLSQQLLSCKNCMEYKNCFGLGINSLNLSNWFYRYGIKTRINVWNKIKFKDKIISNKYFDFLNHIKKSNLKYTDRSLKFASVFLKNSNNDYFERFTYFCRYLHKKEFLFEFYFLKKISKNNFLIEYFYENFYKNLLMRSFAYSVAVSKNKFRESFYFYFISDKTLSNYLCNKKNLIVNTYDFEKLNYISFDFMNNKEEDFKVYSKIENEISFFNFLKKEFKFEISLLKEGKEFYLVRRYDIKGNFKNFKFEYVPKNFEESRLALSKLYDLNLLINNSFIGESIAIDLDKTGKLNKITFYLGAKF